MTSDYMRAFSLRDNPFGPRKQINGMQNLFAMQNLESQPLRIHEEPKLLELFSEKAGPYDELIRGYLRWIEQEGYDGQAKIFGTGSSIILIGGHQGTGKTTLAYLLVHYLKECENGSKKWKIFHNDSPGQRSIPQEQAKSIRELNNKIKESTQKNDHCCVVLDDIVSDAMLPALEVYDLLSNACCFSFIFITTSDLELIDRRWDNSKYPVIPYNTSGVSF